MDFWSRLLAGTPLVSTDKTTSRNPEKRLACFKKEYFQLLSHIKLGLSNILADYESAETIRTSLQELTSILSDESRRPSPHPCISFASSEKIYVQIEKIAILSCNEGIIRESVAIFSTLIESEEEDFVENHVFSRSLMRLLVQITGANSIRLGSDTEVEVVELAFNITTKIRLDPDILPAWFASQSCYKISEKELGQLEKFTGKTNKEDFPLFYLLIEYIHHEGRIGDFARTGLLYIIEAASNSIDLEQWIVESDLATLMATGLGALYSQLSRKLVIDYPDEELAPVLALSDYQHPITNSEIVSSSSNEFQLQIETFLSHLVFWQDVLNHCKSTEIKQTLLDHFQVIFLQQLLYPSLLESSDLDGGSSVAVLTYLRRILEALEHPDMIHLILHYLLALPDLAPSLSNVRVSMSAARQRKSVDLATLMASQVEAKPSPALYNLVDLIHGSLTSPKKETISVTLQLISVILKKHHRYAVTTLFRTSQILSGRPPRTIGAQNGIMRFLLGLAGQLGGDYNVLDGIYHNHVKDCMNSLECHSCSVTMIYPQVAINLPKITGVHATIPGAPRDIRLHTLRADDPMLQIIVEMLGTFLINSVEMNLSLTAAIIDLATCGYMRIDGWLLPDLSNYNHEQDDSTIESISKSILIDPIEAQEEAQIRSLKLARQIPRWTESQIPALLNVLSNVIEQVGVYKAQIPRFDELLQQRRQAFLTASTSISTTKIIHQQQYKSNVDLNSHSSPRPQSALDTLTQRIFSERTTPTRPKSPRGRTNQDRGSKQVTTPESINSSGSRSTSAIPRSARGRETLQASNSSTYLSNYTEKAENSSRHRGAPVNQAESFLAEDQSIMKKKVVLPTADKKVVMWESRNTEDDRKKCPIDQKKENNSTEDDDTINNQEETENQKFVSVNHLLTNVMIVQEFLLELAALVQVRASLFGEVSFG
ncbi:hypothetical protein OnM2_074012 [Erysiphe neolycopersici]|uniref:FHF complex subunit HOOK-interacting protein C-terminal domain-containing protein n=1 Tax=Erysiphe neolycopersici TaxID=212602 RepID=A0A420HIX1_9PEZI|nr:hypothetical protein OnM2_074012 [Erysiphe neolycopersici]